MNGIVTSQIFTVIQLFDEIFFYRKRKKRKKIKSINKFELSRNWIKFSSFSTPVHFRYNETNLKEQGKKKREKNLKKKFMFD